MQVANTLNNTIRILFNPKIEPFKLFDFLIVKSLEDRYLAQIIEIYEDKFDSSQNVAKIKLFYKITKNNEVMPYDNFTPSKECEILKVKAEEVENFINGDSKTFIFATDAKTSQALNIQYDFFNKNAVILSDKIEDSNTLSLNLAKKLSNEKNVVLIDFSGVIEFEEFKKITACKNFKLPLNFSTLDTVFERCLFDASLEFQAVGVEILTAIKKFAKKQEDGLIPFNAFVNVIMEQYKVTPYPELQLLLSRMKKYQMFDIFAKNKKDYESFSKTIQKNKVTIVDLSNVDNIWRKAFVEYIVEELKDEVYLQLRINEECFDTELANKIYNRKQNIKFIPNVSYNYSKLPSIMQYCKNYVLMPSLHQRSDFLDANFALSNLISDECILFGKNTDNFLFLARDFELESQEKRKNYRKIALSLLDSEEAQKLPEDKDSDSQRLIKELSDFEEESIKNNQETDNSEFQDELDEKSDEAIAEEQIYSKETDTFKNIEEVKLSNEPDDEIAHSSFNDDVEDEFSNIEEAKEEDKEDVFQPIVDKNSIPENVPDINTDKEDLAVNEEIIQDVIEEPKEQEQAQQQESNEKKNVEVELSDVDLDFFEVAKNSEENAEQNTEQNTEQNDYLDLDSLQEEKVDQNKNNIIDTTAENNEDDTLDLSDVASSAIENNFEDIINSKTTTKKPTFEIDENTTIQVDVNEAKEDNLPIFKEERKMDESGDKQKYSVGNIVIHSKYGKGEITKIIEYDQRQLLQIKFDKLGTKLLDPKIADIQLEQ